MVIDLRLPARQTGACTTVGSETTRSQTARSSNSACTTVGSETTRSQTARSSNRRLDHCWFRNHAISYCPLLKQALGPLLVQKPRDLRLPAPQTGACTTVGSETTRSQTARSSNRRLYHCWFRNHAISRLPAPQTGAWTTVGSETTRSQTARSSNRRLYHCWFRNHAISDCPLLKQRLYHCWFRNHAISDCPLLKQALVPLLVQKPRDLRLPAPQTGACTTVGSETTRSQTARSSNRRLYHCWFRNHAISDCPLLKQALGPLLVQKPRDLRLPAPQTGACTTVGSETTRSQTARSSNRRLDHCWFRNHAISDCPLLKQALGPLLVQKPRMRLQVNFIILIYV